MLLVGRAVAGLDADEAGAFLEGTRPGVAVESVEAEHAGVLVEDGLQECLPWPWAVGVT